MVLVFDLDDTLYDELSYVYSGFRAVAAWGEQQYGLDSNSSYARLTSLLTTEGRGHIFDHWLDGRGSVREAVRVYRHHTPDITVWASAVRTLDQAKNWPLYLVTDGHKIVQAKKLAALRIDNRFRHAYLTHRYGIAHAKPDLYCFELILRREHCRWEELVYVGDNPAKDFVNLNSCGACTVRVLTGQHRWIQARPGFDARYSIPDLDALLPLLGDLKP